MFSQTSEYALRAVVWLAEHRNQGPVGNKRIASDTQVPASYLSKILHDLASAGFLSSRRGVGGGFQLLADPKELTMLEVVNAVDPLKRITFCAHRTEGEHSQMCPMHRRLNQAIGSVEQILAESTIEDVMQPQLVQLVDGDSDAGIPDAPDRLQGRMDAGNSDFVPSPAASVADHSSPHNASAHRPASHRQGSTTLATY